ncbi:hypothetical protein [Acinetobacter sp. NRRL B-65365]|nr:hypothetical protein [Acinetobacter sp. NRRL B-65365]
MSYMFKPKVSSPHPNAIAHDIAVYAVWRRVYALLRGDFMYFR